MNQTQAKNKSLLMIFIESIKKGDDKSKRVQLCYTGKFGLVKLDDAQIEEQIDIFLRIKE